ncbi:olfactory receptor 10AG1-like [Hyperolius riggenbachi]|uniref:olfactory receptor 10AG1-like n=1 Tax=Hyperolius riggenbachi TaxID=752182 RepID=UPI0035A363CE
MIITLVSYSKSLQSPMYFFLSQLAICDLSLSIDCVPNTLYVVLNEGGNISFAGCLLQWIFFLISECTECLLLTVMAYDRYLAICHPLHYTSITGHGLCKKLAILSWLPSLVYALISCLSVSSLHFCGLNTIDHFFCDLAPILALSCSDISFMQVEAKVLMVPAAICPFLIIMISYIFIVIAILKMSSISGRKKAFFTCSSHLTVVCLYYGTVMVAYMLPKSVQSLTSNKIFAMIYAIVTPSLNPIIYSLRNKDFWDASKNAIIKLTRS